MTITYKNDDYNLYSLILKECQKMNVLPILSKMELWKLRATVKINLNKHGAAFFLVPEGRGNVEKYKLEKDKNYYIC